MPTGRVALVAALLGSTMMEVACPSTKRKSGSMSLLVTTTVWSSTTRVDRAAKVRLSLLVLLSSPARSKEYFTLWALQGSPFWKLTPLRRRKV